MEEGGETSTRASDKDHLSFHHSSEILLGIWCNLALNPFRLKHVDFGGGGFSIGIPKPLSTARVALRVIYLPHALNSTTSHPLSRYSSQFPRSIDH